MSTILALFFLLFCATLIYSIGYSRGERHSDEYHRFLGTRPTRRRFGGQAQPSGDTPDPSDWWKNFDDDL
jgi:hypothetical protein